MNVNVFFAALFLTFSFVILYGVFRGEFIFENFVNGVSYLVFAVLALVLDHYERAN